MEISLRDIFGSWLEIDQEKVRITLPEKGGESTLAIWPTTPRGVVWALRGALDAYEEAMRGMGYDPGHLPTGPCAERKPAGPQRACPQEDDDDSHIRPASAPRRGVPAPVAG